MVLSLRRTLLTCLLATCAAIAGAWLSPTSALARQTFVITGAGFGHGVGLSQWGAYGYAIHGYDYPSILSHYYTGTQLGQTDPNQQIRVLLEANFRRVTFSGAKIANSVSSAQPLDPTKTYTATPVLGGIQLQTGTTKLGPFAGVVSLSGDGPLLLGGHAQNGIPGGHYRGMLELVPAVAGGIDVVNALDLEDYVRGVVAAESPSSWPAAALEAQAVTARTYGLTTKGRGEFDEYATTQSQVYLGVAGETPTTDAAVAATRGQIVTYAGQPVVTFFFSTSGGRTENSENSILGVGYEPWLRGVIDPYDSTSPEHRWQPIRMSMGAAAAHLRGLVRGAFRGIRVTRRGFSPRIISALVLGSAGNTPVSGATLRARFNLMDTWAYFRVVGKPAKPKRKPKPTTGGTGGAAGGGTKGGGTTGTSQGGGTGTSSPGPTGGASA